MVESRRNGRVDMRVQHLGLSLLLILLSANAVFAQEGNQEAPSARVESPNFFNTVKTIVLLPFKGVVCGVGMVAQFPPYWLSGLDTQVESDTHALLASHCNTPYLFSPQWNK
jgi:hypothetical protein